MLPHEQRKELYKYLKDFETNQLIIDAESIGCQILPFIQRGIRNHTSHGITHSIAVMEYVNIINEILLKQGLEFSQTEIQLLYLAGWLHDIGNIKQTSRDTHSIESCKIIEKHLEGKHIQLEKLQSFLEYVIKYHQSKFDLSEVPHKTYKIGGDKIRLHLLCAIFRLADACHMREDRAFKIVFNLIKDDLKPESEEQWKANESIISVNFEVTKKAIEILVDDKKSAKILTNKFRCEFNSVIDYIKDYFPFEKIVVEEIPKTEIDDFEFLK